MKGRKESKKVEPAAAPAAKGSLMVPQPEPVELAALQFAPYNPRVMPKGKMRELKASIRQSGLVLNLVVQRHSEQYGDMVIVGGHQRVEAVRQVCAEEGWAAPQTVWAVVRDLTDAQAKRLNVALNRIEGEFDPYRLGLVLAEVRGDMVPADFDAIGYAPQQVDELVALTLPPSAQAAALEAQAPEIPEFARSITLTLEFATVEARDQAKQLLKSAAGKSPGKKPGDVVLGLLRR